jgi:hypothetical protein
VLAVVEDQERALGANTPRERGGGGLRGQRRQVERARDMLGDQIGVRERGEVDPPRAARVLGRVGAGDGEPETALA